MTVVAVDSYVLNVLMRDLTGHDKRPSAFLVYLFLWNRTFGAGFRTVRVSHQGMAEGTGLSKSTVQGAIRALVRRKLVRVFKASPTAVPEYRVARPWVRRK